MTSLVELSCDQCGSTFTCYPSQAARRRWCSRACRSAGLRKDRVEYRRILVLPDHPLAGAGGLVSEARVVLFEKIGPGEHPCHWCGRVLEWRPGEGTRGNALCVDHVDVDEHNNAPDNLVPSCQSCNTHRDNRIADAEPHVVRKGVKTRAIESICEQCGATFLMAPSDASHRRFCSRPCANDAMRRDRRPHAH